MHKHLRQLLADLATLSPARHRWIVGIWAEAIRIHGGLMTCTVTGTVTHDATQAARFLAKAQALL
jgi:hypothetical protein